MSMNIFKEAHEAIGKYYKKVTNEFEQGKISEEEYLQELIKIDSDLDNLLTRIKLETSLRTH